MNDFIWYSIALAGTAVAGGAVIQFAGKKLVKHLNLILAFGGSYLIGLIFLHLVPEVFVSGAEAGALTMREVGWFVLAGFILQVLLEYLSQGVEHGHYHEHSVKKGFPIMILLSLCLHAFIEAMPLAGGFHHHHHHGHDHLHLHIEGGSLLLGIVIHKFPVALVLAGLLLTSGLSAQKRWMAILLFAAMPVLGMWLSDTLIHLEWIDPNLLLQALSAVLIGILFHISTTILFETSDGHRFNFMKLVIVLAGMIVAALTL